MSQKTDRQKRREGRRLMLYVVGAFVLVVLVAGVPKLVLQPVDHTLNQPAETPTAPATESGRIDAVISDLLASGQLAEANSSNGCYLVDRLHWDSLDRESKEGLTRLCSIWQTRKNPRMPNIVMLDSKTEEELALFSITGQFYEQGFTLFR